jgi:(p)ppGpp synthase/HD superfamily hydrolase
MNATYEKIIVSAIKFAAEAHKGQKRKDGKDYITHPIAVSKIGKENYEKSPPKKSDKWLEIYEEECYIIQICALFHDFEDTKWNMVEELAIQNFELELGINDYILPFKRSILPAIIILNKNNYKNYFDYILSVRSNDYARAVKLADLQHNMSDLQEGSLKDKYRLAEYILKN